MCRSRIKLHDYQVPHAKTILQSLRNHGVAKDGSDCGTGKTPVAAWVASQHGTPVVVICPKIMIPAWSQWLSKADVPAYQVINYEALRGGNRALVSRHTLPGGRREYYTWNLKSDVLLIWDEDHSVAGLDTFNSKLSRAATFQGFKQLYLGATSISGPDKMQALGFALGFHKIVDFEAWCLENGCQRDRFRKLRFGGNRQVLDAIHTHIYGGGYPYGSRMKVADLGDLYPQNRVVSELYRVDSPEQIDRCYTELAEALEELDWKEEEDFDSELVLRLRARQRAELYKVPLLEELVHLHLRDGLSVIVFLSFRESLTSLSERLDKCDLDHRRVTGVENEEQRRERTEGIEDFQVNRVPVILCIDSAGGVGIDLDDQIGDHPRVALVNPSDNAVVFKQVLGRAARSSTKSPVLQKIVCAAETAEEDIYHNLKNKVDRISLINDADLDPLMPILKKRACYEAS